jgi:hypothetical protein
MMGLDGGMASSLYFIVTKSGSLAIWRVNVRHCLGGAMKISSTME